MPVSFWDLNFVLIDSRSRGFSTLPELHRKAFAHDDIFCCNTWNPGLGSTGVGGCRAPIMRGGEPGGHWGYPRDDLAFRAYGGGFRFGIYLRSLVWRSPPDIYGSDTVVGEQGDRSAALGK